MPERDPQHARDRSQPTLVRVIRIALMVLFGALVSRTAWVSEDAHITLRTIDNFWHGYGLRWNVIERVQTYTHPLWMLIVGAAYGITREPAFTTIALCLACTAGVVWLIVKELSPIRACFALALLLSSRAFVDYSTSGLENPLAHVLLAGFWLTYLRTSPATTPRIMRLALLAALVGLTRLDLLLLVLPLLIIEAWNLPWRMAARALLVFALPLAAWHAFSLIYYGFLFPNTAYAKLATGIPAGTLVLQGLRYFRASLPLDCVTPVVIAAGVVTACWPSWRSRPSNSRTLACGVALLAYVAYLVRIGGDYMNGRMLTAPFLCAVLILATAAWAERRRLVSIIAIIALAAAAAMPSSLLRPWQSMSTAYSTGFGDGVVDERALNYDYVGLVPMLRGSSPRRHALGQMGGHYSYMPNVLHVLPWQVVGILGFYAGPGLHIVDLYGLGDPLLARLPTMPGYRAGHYERKAPDWYVPFLTRCAERLNAGASDSAHDRTCLPFAGELNDAGDRDDREVASLYRDLLLVTQGPLWDPVRLRTIARLNLHGSTIARREN